MKAALAALVLGGMLGLIVFSMGEDRWNRRPWIPWIAAQAISEIPQDAAVAGWGDLDGAIVYYYGRDLPDVRRCQGTLAADGGQQQGKQGWGALLSTGSQPIWLFAALEDAQELEALGFVPRIKPSEKSLPHDTPVVMYRPAKNAATERSP